jgi:proline iminopeptidase
MYPDIKPYISEHLEVDGGQRLYLEQCGNPKGLPVVFLHGGPGAGCEPFHRRFFDPQQYRIILFDQRGAGQSTPHASLERNTTPDLIADIETIRKHLAIDRWVVFGGSWGSTLGLAYAEAHPKRVLGLILRGIFLCRDEDIHWFYQHGASRLFQTIGWILSLRFLKTNAATLSQPIISASRVMMKLRVCGQRKRGPCGKDVVRVYSGVRS